jgi:hypothetical protein
MAGKSVYEVGEKFFAVSERSGLTPLGRMELNLLDHRRNLSLQLCSSCMGKEKVHYIAPDHHALSTSRYRIG